MNFEKLSIPLAFLTVLLVWTTTPLAIQWSSEGAPMTSAFYRMTIGMVFCVTVMLITQGRLPLSRESRRIYLVGGISIFLGTALFYSSAQLIPSGWVAVVFGLSPLITGVFSAIVEPEAKLTPSRVFGLLLGLSGLALVFSAGLRFEDASILGLAYSAVAVTITSAASVYSRQLVKDQSITGLQITAGSLIVALPLFMVTAYLVKPGLSATFSSSAAYGVLYLGLMGSGVGFTLYYFLLKRVSASKISLVGLVTPITALTLGAVLNNEPVIANVYYGAILVCTGLIFYEFKPRLGLRRM
ncbi:DMT family transporter [Arenicella sp. 4NH20-0111]|uniref:DMT family transporter n=1 Tax=Arenicella sp. 4NH20-0111 TaxID=3127648 RepID=UPI00333F278E